MTNRMKSLGCSLRVLAVIAVSGLSVGSVYAEVKVATVDLQKVMQGSEAGKKAKTQLETAFNAKKVELQKEEADIKKAHEEFQKKTLVMDEPARQKKQSEIQERIMKLQEKTARSQAEIQQQEQNLTRPILDGVRAVISEIAKSSGYTLVIEKNDTTVLYSEEKDDITVKVLESFNKKKSG